MYKVLECCFEMCTHATLLSTKHVPIAGADIQGDRGGGWGGYSHPTSTILIACITYADSM